MVRKWAPLVWQSVFSRRSLYIFPPSSFLISHRSIISFSPTLSIELLSHALSSTFLSSGIRLPVQCRIYDANTPSFSPTTRIRRLPKSDARSRRLLLGHGSSRCWHGVLAQHMEQNNQNLRAWRNVGQLLYALGRLGKQFLQTDTLRLDRS